MQPIMQSCCGLDVHKSMIKACIAKGPLDKPPKFEIRTYSAMTSDLLKLKDWLLENNVESVAMESTGVYWKPVFNILEDRFDVVLANAQYVKKVPGKKSDVKDCQWIATLQRSGLIPRSFIPPIEIRQLRDLNRTRRKHVGIMASEKNRLQKVLEDANIKLGSVVSDVYGKSSMRMIHALLEKEKLSREEIADMAKGKLKKKVDRLVEALNGKVTEHHRFLISFHLNNIAFQVDQVQVLDIEIQRHMIPFQNEDDLIQTIPGISKASAAAIIAEIGVDMSQFPDDAHLASWAGMCPGNNESAGIKKSSKIRKGNSFLKGTLAEVSWAASKTKGSEYSAIYHGIAKRRGKKRALVALGHCILRDIYRVLKTGEAYVDQGAEAIYQRNSKAREQSMIRSLEKSGYSITKVTA
ncbi:MAG TPA: IS110 family transposase [Methanotrichaceae archaeon]|nr:IS110 family transposase [Methanotrichaceae archaeon]